MDRLEAMATLLAAVESGSLSAAARRLNTPLPTVSRRISELESHLQTKLFNRSNRKLVLTDAGNSFVTACKRILADLSEAERTAAGEYMAPTGELVVTAPLGFGRVYLMPILAKFLKLYPEIKVSVVLSDRVLSIVQDEIDVALRLGALPDSSLMAVRVGSIRRVMCASPEYLKERGTPRIPEDLMSHDCITVAGVTSPDGWAFRINNEATLVPVASRFIVTSAESACEAAREGIGIARTLFHNAQAALKAGELVTVLEEFEPEPWPLHLVYSAGRLPIKVRALIDHTVPLLKKALVN